MRRFVTLMLTAGALVLSACNTVEGFGEDVGSAGDAVEEAADESK